MIDIDLLLACGAAFKKLSAGNIIFNEGSNCSFYYQLVTGSVRLTNIDEEGKEYIQTFIQPGECFGELSLFDEGPYAATAIADEETVVIRLHRSIFQKLITEMIKGGTIRTVEMITTMITMVMHIIHGKAQVIMSPITS